MFESWQARKGFASSSKQQAEGNADPLGGF